MEDGQGCTDEDIELHIPLPQAVSYCEDPAADLEVHQGPDEDSAKGLQSGYGGLADRSPPGRIAARVGHGACSFIRPEGQDLPHSR